MQRIKYMAIIMSAINFLFVLGGVGTGFGADNIDPEDTNAQFAWSENTGWLNAEPGGDGGPGVFVEDDGLSGYLWSETTGWVSLSCLNTASCGTRDYGVTNDGMGQLAGYAWSETVGWVSFSCTNKDSCATTPYGVTIDPETGEFAGRAWSENSGWISFRNQPNAPLYGVTTSWRGVPACVVAPDADLNGDGFVTIIDFSRVASCYGQDPSTVTQCRVADTNCDGLIDMLDVQFIIDNFGQQVP